jgi:acetyltransferase
MLHSTAVEERELPHLAIRPYPTKYVSEWVAKDGSRITFRPVRAEDEPLMVEFHKSLSDRSVYMRFMRPVLLSDRAAHERLSRICHGDYNREIALIAERVDVKPGDLRIMGASRITKMHNTNIARFSMLISDSCQGIGLGSELFSRIIDVARREKLERLETIMTPDNQVMRHLCEKNGFTLNLDEKENVVRAVLKL